MKIKAAIVLAVLIICFAITHTFTKSLAVPGTKKVVSDNTVNYYDVHRYYYKYNRPYYGHRKHYIATLKEDKDQTGIIHFLKNRDL